MLPGAVILIKVLHFVEDLYFYKYTQRVTKINLNNQTPTIIEDAQHYCVQEVEWYILATELAHLILEDVHYSFHRILKCEDIFSLVDNHRDT